MSAPSPLEEAIGHHRASRLAEAIDLYEQILRADPSQPDALNLSGMIARQQGDLQRALERISKAIAVKPDAADYHFNLAEAYRASGRLQEAVASYERSLAIQAK